MTREERFLLFQDLCARLPYGVICTDNRHGASKVTEVDIESEVIYLLDVDEYVEIKNCKPYLRRLSSMTEKEYDELEVLAHGCDCVLHTYFWSPIKFNAKFKTYNIEVIDWLNTHHFDYRGLIEKGLALEAKDEMYKK